MRGDRAERGLAALPEQCPFLLVGRDGTVDRAVLPRDRAHGFHLVGDTGTQAVELDEEDGFGVAG